MRMVFWRVHKKKRRNYSPPFAGSRKKATRRPQAVILWIALVPMLLAYMHLPSAWPILSTMLDPGHGGIDPGAVGRGGLQEKTITLDIAAKVAALLEQQGVTAHMTRTSDSRLAGSQSNDLRARVEFTTRQGADLLVSIHVNSFHLRSVRGPRTYYQPGSEQGQKLAQFIQDRLREACGCGLKQPVAEDHFLTRETLVPAVIVEVGYISNEEEERLLSQDSYRSLLAEAITQGILDYIAAAS